MSLLLDPRPADQGKAPDRRRITVLSGFLGSGKSTLLRSHARRISPLVPRVVVNDYAATEVDDILTGDLRRHQRMVTGGCGCCTRRDELAHALRLTLDDPGDGVADRDVVVETSGLSDPGPIAFTVAHDPVLKHHYTLAEICVTVDAITGAASLDRHAVAMRQVRAADRIFVTKADLVDEPTVRSLVDRIHAVNPTAALTVTAQGEPLWSVPPRSAGERASTAERDPQGEVDPHTGSVSTIEIRSTTPLDWQAFAVWLSLLLHQHGPRVLRVKGLLDVEAVGPVALNGVQHVIHRPEHLTHPVPPGTRLILITEGLETAKVERSFSVFMGLAGKESTS